MRFPAHLRLWVLLSSFPAMLDAQLRDVTFERVRAQEALEGVEVHRILQDSRGYLWLGTERALNRYDGYGFTVFKHEPGNAKTIVLSKVQSLWEDKQGILWVGTWSGLERFDRRTNTFSHFVPNPGAPAGNWSNVIYSLLEDSSGALWTGGDGVRVLDRSTGLFKSFRHDSTDPGSLLFNNCDAVFQDRSGTLWIGTAAGLDLYDRGSGKFRHYWVDENYLQDRVPNYFGTHWIQEIYEDRTGRLWLCTNAGPVAFDRTKGEFKPYPIYRALPDSDASHSVSSVCEDDTGILWIGTWGGGVMTFDAKADSFVSQPHFSDVAPSNSVTALYKDNAGTIWIGTKGDGLFKVVRPRKRFTALIHDPTKPASLSNNSVRFIYENRPGSITIATAMGGDAFDRKTGKFSDRQSWERPYSLTGWLYSRSGTLYTGIQDDGFNRIYMNPYRRKYFSTQEAGLGGSACSFFEDRRGILWMLTNGAGVCQFDPKTEKFKNLGIGGSQPFVAARMIVGDSIDNTADGWALWIGTQDGLWRYDAKADAFSRYGHDPRDPSSISSNTITTVFRDSHRLLWIGTEQGLNRMDSSGGGFTCYAENSGLPDHRVLGVLEDSQSRLWVSTPEAISRFDRHTGRFSSYSMKDVLKDIKFSAGCCLRSTTGEIYFGGNGGIVLFNPDSIRDNVRIPPIVLTGFKKFDIDVPLDTSISEMKLIELSYKENVFSFEFASLDFTKPEDNQYAYILEGVDTSWNYVGGRQFVRYMNVEPGRYRFRVKGSNNDGVWNEEGTSIALVITPPFWKAGWFTIGLWAMAFVSLGGTIRYVERRKLKKRIAELEREQALEQERARISQDMHDEVGSSLSEIAILSELAKRKPEDAGGHVEEISERTAELIDSVSEIVWAMNPKNDTLDNLVSHIRRYAVKYLNLAGVSCNFVAPETVPPSPLQAEVRRNVFLVVKEALHNIVKHSAASAVTIGVELADSGLQLRIEDNGKGFELSGQPGLGNGLMNMRKRMADIGGNFRIDSTPESGTRIDIAIVFSGSPEK